jgi:hypothetical protein
MGTLPHSRLSYPERPYFIPIIFWKLAVPGDAPGGAPNWLAPGVVSVKHLK